MEYEPLPSSPPEPRQRSSLRDHLNRLREVIRSHRSLLWSVPLVAALLLGLALGVTVVAAIHMPRVDSLAEFHPGLITQLYDQKGQIFASYAKERRMMLQEGEVPPLLQQAIIAAEDSNFYRHGGIDAAGVVRAAVKNMAQGRRAFGASTITMQLARQLFLTPEKTWRRKIEQALLAVELEKTFSKQQILTLYCNLVNVGHGNYGMEAGARYYFNKSVEDLALPEVAMLAGIVQRPSRYSPYRAPEAVLRRRNYVLRRMYEEKFIGRQEYEAAVATPLLVVTRHSKEDPAPYFAEEIRRYLEATYGPDLLLEGGLQVRTTLDLEIQASAEGALREGLLRLDRRKGWRGPLLRLKDQDLEEVDLPSWGSSPPDPDRWHQGIVLQSGPRSARVRIGEEIYTLTPEGMAWTGRRSPRDLLKAGDVAWFRLAVPPEGGEAVLHLEQEPELEGAVLVLESVSGAVRAMVGGWDFERSKFNRATQARRQVGSAFKPFVYGAALELGFTPADTLFDAPAFFSGEDGQLTYSPRNYYRKYHGVVTLRRALEQSINLTSVKLMDLVGVERVIDFARRCGVQSPLPPYPSLALGSADLVPLEVAAAFATLANQGTYVEPYLIEEVSDPSGRVLEQRLPRTRTATEPAISYVLTHMLEGVIDRGTAAAVANLKLDLAGKTGTTNDYTDAWFVGYTPRYTILTWVGYDVKRTIGPRMTGAHAALPIWRQVVVDGLARGWLQEGERFSVPPGVVSRRVEARTGLLAGPGAEVVLDEAFVAGTEPVQAYDPQWAVILQLPWYQQRPFYIPKEKERMPEDFVEIAAQLAQAEGPEDVPD